MNSRPLNGRAPKKPVTPPNTATKPSYPTQRYDFNGQTSNPPHTPSAPHPPTAPHVPSAPHVPTAPHAPPASIGPTGLILPKKTGGATQTGVRIFKKLLIIRVHFVKMLLLNNVANFIYSHD